MDSKVRASKWVRCTGVMEMITGVLTLAVGIFAAVYRANWYAAAAASLVGGMLSVLGKFSVFSLDEHENADDKKRNSLHERLRTLFGLKVVLSSFGLAGAAVCTVLFLSGFPRLLAVVLPDLGDWDDRMDFRRTLLWSLFLSGLLGALFGVIEGAAAIVIQEDITITASVLESASPRDQLSPEMVVVVSPDTTKKENFGYKW